MEKGGEEEEEEKKDTSVTKISDISEDDAPGAETSSSKGIFSRFKLNLVFYCSSDLIYFL